MLKSAKRTGGEGEPWSVFDWTIKIWGIPVVTDQVGSVTERIIENGGASIFRRRSKDTEVVFTANGLFNWDIVLGREDPTENRRTRLQEYIEQAQREVDDKRIALGEAEKRKNECQSNFDEFKNEIKLHEQTKLDLIDISDLDGIELEIQKERNNIKVSIHNISVLQKKYRLNWIQESIDAAWDNFSQASEDYRKAVASLQEREAKLEAFEAEVEAERKREAARKAAEIAAAEKIVANFEAEEAARKQAAKEEAARKEAYIKAQALLAENDSNTSTLLASDQGADIEPGQAQILESILRTS